MDATPFVPEDHRLGRLAEAVEGCRGCPLYQDATQAVFGEGPAGARAVFVGEQPGDQEDRSGHPFVGPAGRELDAGLEAAGIDRGTIFVTNAVKHFKWTERGPRRLHQKPSMTEVRACLPWLEAEVDAVSPEVILCLGATASKALLGSSFKVTQERGKVFEETDWAPRVVATVHPSSLLRIPDADARADAREAFVADLRVVAGLL